MEERRRRVIFAAMATVATYIIGVLGYYLLGRGEWSLVDCVYMTAITVTTVGYAEVLPVSTVAGGKLFNIALVLGGLATLLYFASTLMAFLVEGDLQEMLGRKRMEKRLRKLKGHIIVCGVGRTGRHTVTQLCRAGIDTTIIDQNEGRIEGFLAKRGLDVPYVVGDASEESILKQAGIELARGLVCALDSDQANLYTVLTARELNGHLRIVSKISDRRVASKFRWVGVDSVVAPTELGGRRLFAEMTQPATVEFFESMIMPKEDFDLHLEEITVGQESTLAGKTLAEADLRKEVGNVLILGIKDPGEPSYTPTPKPTSVLSAGASLMAMGANAEITRLKEVARG